MSDISHLYPMRADLSDEIDRLRAINADLLAALEWIAEDGASDARATECARDAIAKAKSATISDGHLTPA